MDPNEYIEKRLKDQLAWYDKKASLNKVVFMNYQIVIIFLSAIIPLIVVVGPYLHRFFPGIPPGMTGVSSAIISATIAVFASLDKLMQPQTNWYNYRAIEEILKKEEWMFKFGAGAYKGLNTNDATVLLVERVESVIAADIARTTQSDKQKPAEEKPLDATPMPLVLKP